jgi:hypothetical protein
MIFSAEQITYVNDWRQTPQPDADRHWWRIDLGDSRTGWAWVARSVPPPDTDWIVAELTRQAPLLGHALEGSSFPGASTWRWRRGRTRVGAWRPSRTPSIWSRTGSTRPWVRRVATVSR